MSLARPEARQEKPLPASWLHAVLRATNSPPPPVPTVCNVQTPETPFRKDSGSGWLFSIPFLSTRPAIPSKGLGAGPGVPLLGGKEGVGGRDGGEPLLVLPGRP